MIQTARGGFSLPTRSSSDDDPAAPSPAKLLYGIRAEIGNDELMSAAHQPARHVGAHASPDLPFPIACFLLQLLAPVSSTAAVAPGRYIDRENLASAF